jgi:hypothetical protein
MVERLQSAAPGYPVKQYFGDYQHFVQNKRKEWSDLCAADHHVCTLADYPGGDLNADPPSLARRGLNDDLSDFVDHYAKPRGNPGQPEPSHDVTASLQICPANAGERFPLDEPGERFSAPTFQRLAPNTLTIERGEPQDTTSKAAPNTHAVAADPVANMAANSSRCPSGAGPAGPGVASYDSPALPRDFTMIGATRVTVSYEATGGELQLNARLYDVAPGGSAVMVDRGFRALTRPDGQAVFDLLGNGWRFERGHRVRVELAQDDDPYIKASTLPSRLQLDGVTLQLPVREASATLTEAVDNRESRARGRDGDAQRAKAGGAVSAATGSGRLPFTGFDIRPMFVLGIVLLAGGLWTRSTFVQSSQARPDQHR